jgi:hypothetical protein
MSDDQRCGRFDQPACSQGIRNDARAIARLDTHVQLLIAVRDVL